MPRYRTLSFVLTVIATWTVATQSSAQPAATIGRGASQTERLVTFAESREVIDNPERGFSVPAGLDGRGLSGLRADRGVSLVRIDGRLDSWREAELPATLLSRLDARLDEVRAAGLKTLLRFMYNEGPYPNSAPDASLDWILRHIAQLKPLLRKHADVIVWMEAGFIGAWGEWHTSTHGLDRDTGAKRAVLDALLDALPPSRSILLRYPGDLASLYGATFTAKEAHTGKPKARIGHHNDCFLASENDSGTYGRERRSIAEDKAMIAAYGKFTPIGGESCKVNPPRSDCPTALAELEQLGFSELNLGYHPGVLDNWRSGGCFDTIRSRFGYRLWAEQIALPQMLVPGREARITIKLRNSGFAAPLSARPLYLVLEGPARRLFKLPIDQRKWAAGKSHTIDLAAEIPADLPAGTYALGLWMPDEAASLRADPRYAVRLANDGAWDQRSGVNRLVGDIPVRPARPPSKPLSEVPMGLGVKPRP